MNKWLPVVSYLDIPSNKQELVCNYCEHYTTLNSSTLTEDNHLVISLKIIERLLKAGINIDISDKPEKTYLLFKVRIDTEYLSVEHYEHLVIEEISKFLIEKTNNDIIKIYNLISKRETTDDRVVKFYSNFRIITRKQKLEKILKIRKNEN